ncbi:plastocyanin/azurin family copper-binding protein [Chitinispirillales bacterium ANBcel5]|uniref:cupredoxin domain-containing protein n=1 Tax=Cellulosispirillum alkaliphilum TaxID=3039283 RepID=UPI002A528020|nr:plastocyanin/azurin family copper-binding protein [Chitinispirillales bacterium ANBcel5]
MKYCNILILSFCLFTLISCNTNDTETEQLSENDTVQYAVTIEMTDVTFEPDHVTIIEGETVRWINTSQVTHTVTADSGLAVDNSNVILPRGAEPINSGSLAPGEIFDYRFDVPGLYRYFCVPHEAAEMVGEVLVETQN